MRHERTRTDGRVCPTLQKHGISPHLVLYPRLKMYFFSSGNSRWDIPRLQHARSRYIRHAYGATHAPPRQDRGGQNTCLDIPLPGVCRSTLSLEQWRLALSKLEKKLKFESSRIKNWWAWADVSCFADQLTDNAIFLRVEHTKRYTW